MEISKKGIGRETLALILAISWLIFISLAHFFLQSHKYLDDRLKVGFLPITCHLLLPVALARSEDIKNHVEPLKFSSWPDMIEAIKGNELDAALILAPIALSLMAQDVPVEIALLGHREGTALVVSDKSNIRSPSDFIGKSVAIPIRFSTQNLSFLRLLKKNSISPKDVNIVELPPPDMPSALASGAIDAYIVGEPYATQAEMIKKGKIFLRTRDIWPNFISSILVVRKDAIKNKKHLIDRFIRSLFKQASWVETHRERAAIITAKFFGLSEALIKRVLLKKEVYYKDLIPKKKEFDFIGKLMVEFGLMSKMPPCYIYGDWQ